MHASPAPPRRSPAERARGYLERNPAQHTSLDMLASAAGVSKYHLVRVFRERYGVPPHAYAMRVRAGLARALLAEGRTPREVADEAGFADVSHLTREFKREFGTTPGRFRKERKGVQSADGSAEPTSIPKPGEPAFQHPNPVALP